MRGEPPHTYHISPLCNKKNTSITLRPYYITKGAKKVKSENVQNQQNHKMVKMCKTQNAENAENVKMKKYDLPLRPENVIPYGRRGTPWKPQNPKNAGPGGSEITKCRFCPFICHFGHF